MAALAGLVAGPAAASWMVPPPGYRAKDFAVVKRDGLYHIFYTRSNRVDPFGQTEKSFGHATSPDLYAWTQRDTVLPVRPDHWDNRHVWAPGIIEVDGVYYMYYTGITHQPPAFDFHQRIGLAISTDLFTWTRGDAPLFACDQVPWSHCDPTVPTGGNFRDPFVMAQPESPGQYLMFYSTHPAADPGHMIVGVAKGDGPEAWSDLKPLWITHVDSSGYELAESPHVIQHGNRFMLFWTSNGPQPIVFQSSSDPTSDPGSWEPRATLAAMLGINTAAWFASEWFRDGLHEYFAFINDDRVDMREITWIKATGFRLGPPALFHIQNMSWSASEVEDGQVVQLRFEGAVNFNFHSAQIEAVEVDAGGGETPIPLDSLGLPSQVPITADTTVISWVARDWPDLGDGSPGPEIVVRLRDRTASTDPLLVGPKTPPGSSGGGSGGISRPMTLDEPAFRALERTPLGDGPAVLLDLPVALPARVDVFDVTGRRVSALADRTFEAGAHVLLWDGRAATGARAAAGVYFVRLKTARGISWARIALRR